MPKTNVPGPISDLLGGWMPKEWWGDTAAPKPKPARRPNLAESSGLKKRDQRVQDFRRRYYEVVAITAADVKARRACKLPFTIDLTRGLNGETYFLILCQTLYRERACKKVLGEPMAGEDLIERLIYWWSQGPLEAGHLRNAMEGTSLALEEYGDDGEDDDD